MPSCRGWRLPPPELTHLQVWSEREAIYRATEHRGSEEIDALRLSGSGRLGSYLFTAPHSVRTLRRGEPKQADMGTGGLAEALAEITGNLALTALGRQSGDPNWDLGEGPFKRRVLLHRVRAIVDLHGFRGEGPEDLILGLGPAANAASRNLAARLLASARRQGLVARTGPPFDATWPGTITATVQAAGGTALQVEVAGGRRRPRTRPADAQPLLAALLAVFGPPETLSAAGAGVPGRPAFGSAPSPC